MISVTAVGRGTEEGVSNFGIERKANRLLRCDAAIDNLFVSPIVQNTVCPNSELSPGGGSFEHTQSICGIGVTYMRDGNKILRIEEESSRATGSRHKNVKLKKVRDVGGVMHKGAFCNWSKYKNKGNCINVSKSKDIPNETSYIHLIPSSAEPVGEVSEARKMCYGHQEENSDIARNNLKQWGCLEEGVGEKLWAAIEALRVVEGESKMSVLNKFQEAVVTEKKNMKGWKGNPYKLK